MSLRKLKRKQQGKMIQKLKVLPLKKKNLSSRLIILDNTTKKIKQETALPEINALELQKKTNSLGANQSNLMPNLTSTGSEMKKDTPMTMTPTSTSQPNLSFDQSSSRMVSNPSFQNNFNLMQNQNMEKQTNIVQNGPFMQGPMFQNFSQLGNYTDMYYAQQRNLGPTFVNPQQMFNQNLSGGPMAFYPGQMVQMSQMPLSTNQGAFPYPISSGDSLNYSINRNNLPNMSQQRVQVGPISQVNQ